MTKNDIKVIKKNGTENQIIPLNSTAQTVVKKALLNPSESVFYSP